MKTKFNLKVFILVILIISITSILIVSTNYIQYVKNLEVHYLGKARVDSYDITSNIESTLETLMMDIKELKLSLSQNEDLEYEINDFMNSNDYIEGIYIYENPENLQFSVDLELQRYDKVKISFEKNPIEGISWWDYSDGKDYVFHSKVKLSKFETNSNISIIIDMNRLMKDMTDNYPNYKVSDAYYNVVNTSDDKGELLKIDQNTQKMVNGYFDQVRGSDGFYSYGSLDVEDLELYYFYILDASDYKSGIRGFFVRNFGISLFSISIGLLIGWRMIKMIHKEILKAIVDKRYQSSEFAILDKKLKIAINWIEDVMGHYYELEHLKEELTEIVDNIPKEGELHDKEDTKTVVKKNKRRS